MCASAACTFTGRDLVDGAAPAVDAAPPGDAPDGPGGVDGDVPPDAALPPDAFGCPASYTERVPGSCYRLVTTGRTWDAAEADCEAAGAHLAVVDDPTENAFVSTNQWIGATENVTPGTFVWVTGAALGFTGWATGEPGAAGGASCVEARTDGWHDDNGPELKPYACEYDGVAADPAAY